MAPHNGEGLDHHNRGDEAHFEQLGGPLDGPGTSGKTTRQDRGMPVDPRLSLLLRASVMFDLIQAGLLELDEAFDGVDRACRAISPCYCQVEMMRGWMTQDREIAERRLREWRWRPAATPTWRRP